MCTRELLFKKINIFYCSIKDILETGILFLICIITFVCMVRLGDEENNAFLCSLYCFDLVLRCPWLIDPLLLSFSQYKLSFSQTQWKTQITFETIYLFWEREDACMCVKCRRQRGREIAPSRPWQSVQSRMRSSVSQTVRSWPDLKSRVRRLTYWATLACWKFKFLNLFGPQFSYQ